MFRNLRRLAIALLVLPMPVALAADGGLADAVREEIAMFRDSGRLSAEDMQIAGGALLESIYELRQFAPAWQESAKVEALLQTVRASYADGLNPADYHLQEIEALRPTLGDGKAPSLRERAAFDLLLTDSLMRLVYHQAYGKVDLATRDPAWAIGRPLNHRDAASVIAELIDAKDLADGMPSIVPRQTRYERLREQLQRHRSLRDAGGWPEVSQGATIRPGSADTRIGTLARRLAISGDLAGNDSSRSAAYYDEDLQDAVRRFQKRHGLEADALVGRATLRALNVSIEQRIDQIRLNLERLRWYEDTASADFILVNVAAYEAYVVRDGKTVWTTNVIVGDVDNQTPLFSATLKYLVFNPTWTVPHRIASEELLPKIKQDSGFLAKGNYQLFDPAGNRVEASSVDWSAIERDSFRFTLVQQPGPANQLGEIKFVFPNEHSVCMHDTPQKSLFANAIRAFSHGCVRVDKPNELAEVLLGSEGWTRAQIDAEIDSARTKNVNLAKPLPVLLRYWTADVDDNGVIHFYPDIYDRDAAVLESLEGPM